MKSIYFYLLGTVLVLAACTKSETETPGPGAATLLNSSEVSKTAVSEVGESKVSNPADWEKAFDAVRNMGAGWNLGNTLDPIRVGKMLKPSFYEKYWGQPITRPEMFVTFKEAGFNAIRLPVSWGEKMNSSNVIMDEWMDRVEEVVNYILDAGMYCIINVHHDTGTDGWLHADLSKYPENSVKFKAIWAQIAERFADYDYHLLFEGYNEILDKDNHWNETDADSYEAANRLNQDFVDVIRASSSENNRNRNLIVNTYAASCTKKTLDSFVMPRDSVCRNRLIAEVHMYSPYNFALNEEKDAQGKKPSQYQYTKFDASGQQEIANNFSLLSSRFTYAGIPCIIGEYGAIVDKGNTDERVKHTQFMVRNATRKNMGHFFWMRLMEGRDRTDCKWTEPQIKDAIIDTYNELTSVRPIYE